MQLVWKKEKIRNNMKSTKQNVFDMKSYQVPAVERIDIKAERGFAMSASSPLPDLGYEEKDEEF